MSKIIQKKAAEQAINNKNKEQVVIADVSASVQSRKRKAESVATTTVQKVMKPNKKGSTATTEQSSIIYLGHLPNGFYEPQLKKFFMQFGIVRKLKLFRSPKTGGTRGFAFLQFESAETAQTVADAMHGYFIHDKQLVSHVVPTAKHHEGMWKMKKPTEEMLEQANKASTGAEKKGSVPVKSVQSAHEALLKKMAEKLAKLNALGFEFEIPALKS